MSCGCRADCTCADAGLTPIEVVNRPGLSEIAYRSGTYARFRAHMLSGLSRRETLRSLTTREADDPAIAIVDAWAVAADVLTFYTERIANESFLGTATERGSVRDLTALIGYRVAPGVSASTWLAITAETTPAAPDESIVPRGTRVQTIPGPGEVLQSFETEEDVAVRPDWNRFDAIRTRAMPPTGGDSTIRVAGLATGLRRGDRILLVAGGWKAGKWAVVRVSGTTLDEPEEATVVTFVRELPSGAALPFAASDTVEAFVLKARGSLFGFNAPNPMLFDPTIRKELLGGDDEREWEFDALSSTIALDAVYEGVDATGWVLLERPGMASVLARVTGVAETSMSKYAVSARVTTLSVGETSAALAAFGATATRTTTVSFRSEPLEIASAVDRRPLWGSTIGTSEPLPASGLPRRLLVRGVAARVEVTAPTDFDGPWWWWWLRRFPPAVVSGVALEMLPAGAKVRVRVRKDDGDEVTIVATPSDVQPLPPQPGDPVVGEVVLATTAADATITLASPLTRAYSRYSPIDLFGNVAPATHGETAPAEVLGSGDAQQAFQRFTLRKAPLTFVPADTPSGTASTLEVRVNDVRWHEVRSLFGAGASDRLYTTSVDDRGVVTLTFGDGITGARLPTGVDNVVARYRTGIGAPGRARAEQIMLPVAKPLGMKSAINPLPAAGAQDPQSAADAKIHAPRSVLTLGRVVSLQDYADFASDYAGVAKATSTWTWDGRRRGIHVTIASADGAAVDAGATLIADLRRAVRSVSDARAPLEVHDFRPVPFALTAHVRFAADFDPARVLDAVRRTLLGQFAFARRDFGADVSLSGLSRTIHDVPGVEAVRFVRLHRVALTPTLEERLDADIALPGTRPGTLGAEILIVSPDHVDLEGGW